MGNSSMLSFYQHKSKIYILRVISYKQIGNVSLKFLIEMCQKLSIMLNGVVSICKGILPVFGRFRRMIIQGDYVLLNEDLIQFWAFLSD